MTILGIVGIVLVVAGVVWVLRGEVLPGILVLVLGLILAGTAGLNL